MYDIIVTLSGRIAQTQIRVSSSRSISGANNAHVRDYSRQPSSIIGRVGFACQVSGYIKATLEGQQASVEKDQNEIPPKESRQTRGTPLQKAGRGRGIQTHGITLQLSGYTRVYTQRTNLNPQNFQHYSSSLPSQEFIHIDLRRF